jgi:hypothetical protein
VTIQARESNQTPLPLMCAASISLSRPSARAAPLRLGELAGPLDGRRRDVDPERAACPGHARGLTGRLPAPASDVQDMIVGLDAPCPAQYLMVQPQFGVVVNEASLQILPADADHGAPGEGVNVSLAGGALTGTGTPKSSKVISTFRTVCPNDSSASSCRTRPCWSTSTVPLVLMVVCRAEG